MRQCAIRVTGSTNGGKTSGTRTQGYAAEPHCTINVFAWASRTTNIATQATSGGLLERQYASKRRQSDTNIRTTAFASAATASLTLGPSGRGRLCSS